MIKWNTPEIVGTVSYKGSNIPLYKGECPVSLDQYKQDIFETSKAMEPLWKPKYLQREFDKYLSDIESSYRSLCSEESDTATPKQRYDYSVSEWASVITGNIAG